MSSRGKKNTQWKVKAFKFTNRNSHRESSKDEALVLFLVPVQEKNQKHKNSLVNISKSWPPSTWAQKP